jgi:hypothetical protein
MQLDCRLYKKLTLVPLEVAALMGLANHLDQVSSLGCAVVDCTLQSLMEAPPPPVVCEAAADASVLVDAKVCRG